MNNKIIIILFLLLSGFCAQSQVVVKNANSFEAIIEQSFLEDVEVQQSFTYKVVNGKALKIHGFFPEGNKANQPRQIFIHGGGWKGGTVKSSLKWCRYLSELGCVAFSIEYRLSNGKLDIKPSTCLEDVKSAVRWVRKNAEKFNIDTVRIAYAGTSAGGHLATACATIGGFNDVIDDLSISCKPKLLLLSSPVIDNGPNGYGYERVEVFWEDFSPVHNLNEMLPPTCILLGDKDPLIPFQSAVKVGKAVKDSDSDIAFYVFEGEGHGLFSQKNGELTEPIMLIYYHWQKFLARNGYLEMPGKLKSDYAIVLTEYKL